MSWRKINLNLWRARACCLTITRCFYLEWRQMVFLMIVIWFFADEQWAIVFFFKRTFVFKQIGNIDEKSDNGLMLLLWTKEFYFKIITGWFDVQRWVDDVKGNFFVKGFAFVKITFEYMWNKRIVWLLVNVSTVNKRRPCMDWSQSDCPYKNELMRYKEVSL